MNNPFNLQTKIIQWLNHFGTQVHTEAKIKRVCKEFAFGVYSSDEAYRMYYDSFLPLVRSGIVECVNNNSYQLGQAVLLQNKEKFVGINLPISLIKKIEKQLNTTLSAPFNTYNFTDQKEWKAIKSITKTYNINVQKTITNDGLSQIKRIKKIPSLNWREVFNQPKVKEYFYYGWKSVREENRVGIYRTDSVAYAIRYFMDEQRRWYLIPDDPDGFNLAVIVTSLHSRQLTGVSYHRDEQTLSINTFFPILVERLLRRRTLDIIGIRKDYNAQKIHQIPYSLFKKVNKIFDHQIEII